MVKVPYILSAVLAALMVVQSLLGRVFPGYGAYNYAYYMLGVALNAFFPLYIAALLLSVVTLILALSRINVAETAASFRPKTPVRIVGATSCSSRWGSPLSG